MQIAELYNPASLIQKQILGKQSRHPNLALAQ